MDDGHGDPGKVREFYMANQLVALLPYCICFIILKYVVLRTEQSLAEPKKYYIFLVVTFEYLLINTFSGNVLQ